MTNTVSSVDGSIENLPSGWAKCSLNSVSKVNPRFHKSAEHKNKEVTFIPMKAVSEVSGRIDLSEVKHLSDVQGRYTAFREGDVLFAKITPCMENGKIAIAYGLKNEIGFGSTEFHVIRPNEALLKEFIFHYLTQRTFRADAERNMTGSAGQRRVPTKYLQDVEIFLPPINEQRRIVEKIEELFTKLDAGMESLKKTQSLLKKYRQSVLKAAVTGELSREWREEHADELEPASELLERILEERREKWTGKKYKEPAALDTSELPTLPDKWIWSNFERLSQARPNALKAGPFGSALKKSYYVPHGYKIYGQEQVLRNDPNYGDYYIDEKRYRSLESCKVAPGDILVSLVGTVGRTLVLPHDIEPGIINPRLVKFSLDKRLVEAKYIQVLLDAPVIKEYFALASHGGTMDILNLSILKALPIPLPPMHEQRNIIGEVERQLSIMNKLEATVEENLKRSESLRQSILKRAFSGQLVPQNPEDEPASVLLARIREERLAANQRPKKRRSRKQPEASSLFTGSEE